MILKLAVIQVACETASKTGMVMVFGEITTTAEKGLHGSDKLSAAQGQGPTVDVSKGSPTEIRPRIHHRG
jgi:S-adenosylmethionine synthetase